MKKTQEEKDLGKETGDENGDKNERGGVEYDNEVTMKVKWSMVLSGMCELTQNSEGIHKIFEQYAKKLQVS